MTIQSSLPSTSVDLTLRRLTTLPNHLKNLGKDLAALERQSLARMVLSQKSPQSVNADKLIAQNSLSEEELHLNYEQWRGRVESLKLKFEPDPYRAFELLETLVPDYYLARFKISLFLNKGSQYEVFSLTRTHNRLDEESNPSQKAILDLCEQVYTIGRYVISYCNSPASETTANLAQNVEDIIRNYQGYDWKSTPFNRSRWIDEMLQELSGKNDQWGAAISEELSDANINEPLKEQEPIVLPPMYNSDQESAVVAQLKKIRGEDEIQPSNASTSKSHRTEDLPFLLVKEAFSAVKFRWAQVIAVANLASIHGLNLEIVNLVYQKLTRGH